ncbi:MAG: hypothetical protein EA368_14220 [Leptolyngbya sp. DLM2.Bin27]|nr:MAG: hypothetical protein EA368_14220 [Leptolyngbya sp. DLM2.Bin27]
MPQAFLTSPLPSTDTQATINTEPAAEPGREKVVLTVRGSIHATERVIHEAHRVGFAEVREWSKPVPTGKINEVLRVLTRYVIVE